MGSTNAVNQLWLVSESGDAAYFMELFMVITESHSLESDITEHRVERGSNITDHIRNKPDKVSFEVFISNQPLDDPRMVLTPEAISLPKIPGPPFPSPGAIFGAVGGAIASLFSSPPDPTVATVGEFSDDFDNVQDALEKLEACKNKGLLMNVYTGKRHYQSMLLQNISMGRSQADGDGATLHLEFKQVRIVESKKTKAPVATQPRTDSEKNKGSQKGEERKKSLLVQSGVPGSHIP